MATAAPARPQAAPVQYAGFWIRFVAAFIDGIIVGIANGIVSVIFGFGRATAVADPNNPLASLPVLIAAASTSILIGTAMSFVYHAYLESSEKQATLGKMIVGIKVTDLNGQRISFARAAGRYFSKYISAMLLMIGYIMAGFTEKKQALHDMIASTLVVKA